MILVCGDMKIEVKAFTSTGPASFGSNEKWNELIFVDASDFKSKNFKIYIIALSNDHDKWKNIKVNSNETFFKQCVDGKRPRIKFSQIKTMLNEYVELLFSGKLSFENNKINFNNLLLTDKSNDNNV